MKKSILALCFFCTLLGGFSLMYEAEAFQRRSTLILYVAKNQPTPELRRFGEAFGASLSGRRRVKLPVPPAASPGATVSKRLLVPEDITPGDLLYDEARKTYYSGDVLTALQQMDQAIVLLKDEPGVQGRLVEAWLFKAEIFLEEQHMQDALSALAEAAALNLAMPDLDPFGHTTRLRQQYRAAYRSFVSQHKIEEMKVNVGSSIVPIYVNGVWRGTGPDLTIRFPQGKKQILRAGDSIKGRKVVSSESEVVLGRGKASPFLAAAVVKDATTLRPAPLGSLVSQAVQQAQMVQADEVLLLGSDKEGEKNFFTLVVVDVVSGKISRALTLEAVAMGADVGKIIAQADDFLNTLNIAAYNGPVDTQTQQDKPKSSGGHKKSFFKSPAGIAIIGVLVAGAGTGAVLALSGGGGGATPTPTTSTMAGASTITISGPVPAGP